jgi:hypothetical protein
VAAGGLRASFQSFARPLPNRPARAAHVPEVGSRPEGKVLPPNVPAASAAAARNGAERFLALAAVLRAIRGLGRLAHWALPSYMNVIGFGPGM